VAWVHPTWRDLVIERLAADEELRHRFLAHCGPHGIALALSTQGGTGGERALPLIGADDDWDAIADRIYALAPELEEREAVTVLTAVENLLLALLDDCKLSGECAALARTAVERFGEVWESAHTSIALPCIDAWLSVAVRLKPQAQPTFLAKTWAELLPVKLPDPDDLLELQRFIDWRALCDMVADVSPELLRELGYAVAHEEMLAAFWIHEHVGPARRAPTGEPSEVETFTEQLHAQRASDSVVRRVLNDL
jgi:hypothetical protein